MTASGPRWGVPARVVALQAVVALLAAVLALIGSVDAAKSALLGGIAAWLPNAYFAWRLTRPVRQTNDAAVRLVGRTLGWWAVKMALTITLLVAVLAVADVDGLGFILGLVAVLLAPLAAPLLGGDEPSGPGKRVEEAG